MSKQESKARQCFQFQDFPLKCKCVGTVKGNGKDSRGFRMKTGKFNQVCELSEEFDQVDEMMRWVGITTAGTGRSTGTGIDIIRWHW